MNKMIKNITQCGQCTKSSCNGCSNYLGRVTQQTTTKSAVSEAVIDIFAVSGLFGMLILLFII